MTSTDADLLNFSAHARVLLGLTAIAWLVHAVNFNGWLNEIFGLRPRSLWGLVCIPLRPFVHSDFDHLWENTLVFLPLAWFTMMQGIHLFYVVTIAVTLLSGLSLWLFGERIIDPKKPQKERPYVGASSLIFGYLGFVLIYGITSNSLIALILGAIAGYKYLGKVTGDKDDPSLILPGCQAAWLGHFSGFVTGILAAFALSSMRLN